MIPMQCILATFLAFVFCCNCQSNALGVSTSWAKLQISPDTLTSMEFGNFLIEIYEHANNHKATTTASQKKYFYSPIALLDHTSAVSTYNRVTKQQEMRFRVDMWNDKVQNEVVKHLNKSIGQEIQSDKVRVIPLEKVILTSNIPTADYSLSPVWTIYDKSKTLRLSLSCYDQKVCDELAFEMRTNPTQFDHLKLLYSLSSQTSQTKQTTIGIDSVTSGQMVSNLLQKFGDKKEVFLTANDEKKMLTETATNIRMETFDDSEVGSPDTEFQIFNLLKDLLVASKTTIKEQSDKMWDSVFWNEDNYRPDKTTKTLNEIIKKLDKETQKKLVDLFQKAERQSEITEKLTSSNNDAEKRREKQLLRENQSKEANEKEMRSSQATDQEQSSHNQTRDDKSNTIDVDTEVSGQGFGFSGSAKVEVENSNTHNTEQQNENSEKAKKNSDEHNRNLEKKETILHNYDSNSWANVDRISSTISGKMANDSDTSRRAENLKEDVKKLLQESRDHVQWDGEKFVPKPMKLSRINLSKFRDSQSFQDRNVRVRYTNAELSAPIKFMEHTELTVVNEWENMKDELKETRELLKTTAMNLLKTNIELGNVKSNLTDARIDLTNKLEGTEQELVKTKTKLEKTRTDLGKTIDTLSQKLNATERELTEMKISVGNLSSRLEAMNLATEKEFAGIITEMKIIDRNLTMELKTNSQRFGKELKDAEDNLRKQLTGNGSETSTQLETTTTNLNGTTTTLIKTISIVADLKAALIARTREIVDINQMPTSCRDLYQMGQKISGFFFVKGSNKMEMVYCDFYPNENDLQKWVGYVDVKSEPVHFYVQRNNSFVRKNTPILFELQRLNVGSAMNLTSGIFTAPRMGTYFFSFTGHARFPTSSSLQVEFGVSLRLNRNAIGVAWVDEYNTIDDQLSPLTIQSTLNLNKDDRVWLETYGSLNVALGDNSNHNTHFTGFLLEEEIVTSL